MKIGIALNDVLRDFSSQFVNVVSKYRFVDNLEIPEDVDEFGNLKPDHAEDTKSMQKLTSGDFKINTFKIDLEKTPLDTFDLLEFLGRFKEIDNFLSVDDLNLFMYGKAALEIFGHADLKEGKNHRDNIMTRFNKFLIEITDEEEHEIQLVSREAINSIPATYFFLAKTLCRASDINFTTKYENMWNDVDILVCANPRTLKSKPKDKISVKIKTPYNEDVEADYELDSLIEFMENEELREAILNREEITKEEKEEE